MACATPGFQETRKPRSYFFMSIWTLSLTQTFVSGPHDPGSSHKPLNAYVHGYISQGRIYKYFHPILRRFSLRIFVLGSSKPFYLVWVFDLPSICSIPGS